MNIDRIFICPGIGGYEFSPTERKVDARLLMLLSPTSVEIQEHETLIPVLRADWLRTGWLTPKRTVLAMAGLRANLPESAVQRGSGSVWAVATIFSVATTPSPSLLAPKLINLVENLCQALHESITGDGFSNTTHRDLVTAARQQDLDSAMARLKNMAAFGLAQGPFQDQHGSVIK